MRTDELLLDDRSPVPVYVQLAEQVLHALARGSLRNGDRLPAVRDVAAMLGVNPNTVNRAYSELQREGVLETKRGRGTFVAKGGRGRSKPARGQLDDLAERYVARARSLGFEREQIGEAVVVQLRRQR
ncbi:MAG TPA: GntR family transcriptional regulator [Verrucomicrobiae bacterium]|jgi:GntR family transcriptional regulator|nr:GntR family transcriptional regulator [Verrucomicrobiae bacterium]